MIINNNTIILYSRTTSTNTAFCSSAVSKCCTSSSLNCRPPLAMTHHYTNNQQPLKGNAKTRLLASDWSMSPFSWSNWILGCQLNDERGHRSVEKRHRWETWVNSCVFCALCDPLGCLQVVLSLVSFLRSLCEVFRLNSEAFYPSLRWRHLDYTLALAANANTVSELSVKSARVWSDLFSFKLLCCMSLPPRPGALMFNNFV